jgi:hypothetical protein
MNVSVSAPTDSFFRSLSQVVLEVLVTLKVSRRSVHNKFQEKQCISEVETVAPPPVFQYIYP